MLAKKDRLTVTDLEALSRGISVFSTLISLRYCEAPSLKFAVSVSKKVAPSAVLRNRIRRRTYSIVQKLMPQIQKKAFIMLMPKKEFAGKPIAELEVEMKGIFSKAHLL